jgi:transposase
MPRKRSQPKLLDTIWEASDKLWAYIEPILRDDWQPSPKGGQPPKDWRPMFNGIIHRLRSGCQWNHLPKQFGSDRTMHRWFQRWCQSGVMERIWAVLAAQCQELGEVHWNWQSADGHMDKAGACRRGLPRRVDGGGIRSRLAGRGPVAVGLGSWHTGLIA